MGYWIHAELMRRGYVPFLAPWAAIETHMNGKIWDVSKFLTTYKRKKPWFGPISGGWKKLSIHPSYPLKMSTTILS